MAESTYDSYRAEWTEREVIAEQMIPLIGQLYRENGVVTSVHGHRIINLSAVGILEALEKARQLGHDELSVRETLAIVEALAGIDPGPSSVDVARLSVMYRDAPQGQSAEDFVRDQFAQSSGRLNAPAKDTDVVLYGFGRIGRILARILITHAGNGHGLRLRAVVVRKGADTDLIKRASLLARDSVHGAFAGTVSVDEPNNVIVANGTRIQFIYADDPAKVDYTAYGIDKAIVVDNTGRWRDQAGLEQHLKSKGVSRVLLTAPGKGDLKNIVYGINHTDVTDKDAIVSAASCTTNAITPVIRAVDVAFGLVRGHVETVHSFTNDQNLTDNFHKGDRRGRSAVLNMVITETGAAKAVAKAVPELEGKLTGSAIRVPTPDVSLAVLNLTLENPTTKDQLNDFFRHVSLHSKLRQQIDYVESPEIVSTDFVGSHKAGIVDGIATIATGTDIVLYVWYDNEYGYSTQVIRLLEYMAGVNPVVVPPREKVMELAEALRAGLPMD